jgi:glyoxylase-like metal-dependent hydrolase (beta-lactamase superfamily II)
MVWAGCKPCPVDRELKEGDEVGGFEVLFTPGHSPGHISYYRDRDGTLIAGDAFVTQKQESLIGALTHAPELRGPPAYFTADWRAAWQSVERLAALKPKLALTGHGLPMRDPPLTDDLNRLARSFAETSIPPQGRYVDRPAVTNSRGVVSLPPKPFDVFSTVALTMLGLFVAGAVAYAVSPNVRCDGREDV